MICTIYNTRENRQKGRRDIMIQMHTSATSSRVLETCEMWNMWRYEGDIDEVHVPSQKQLDFMW